MIVYYVRRKRKVNFEQYSYATERFIWNNNNRMFRHRRYICETEYSCGADMMTKKKVSQAYAWLSTNLRQVFDM